MDRSGGGNWRVPLRGNGSMASESETGLKVCCPQCRTSFGVPHGTFRATCPSCRHIFWAEDHLAQEADEGREDRAAAASVGGYRVLREVGSGGMGVVYLASHPSEPEEVALKVLHGGALAGSKRRTRFLREAEAIALLDHPSIVKGKEYGEDRDTVYFSMEFIHGQPIDEFIRARQLDIDQTVRLMMPVCDAVNYAHKRGVVHRDLKPDNILVDSNDVPKILDFGLAKVSNENAAEEEMSVLTLAGQMLGTLPYMSPEQTMGQSGQIDHRTDIYALGVILYELITGRLPVNPSGNNALEVMRRIREETPRRPSDIVVKGGPALEAIILKCLSKRKSDRYETAKDLAVDLDNYLNGRPVAAAQVRRVPLARGVSRVWQAVAGRLRLPTLWGKRWGRGVLIGAAVLALALALAPGAARRWSQRRARSAMERRVPPTAPQIDASAKAPAVAVGPVATAPRSFVVAFTRAGCRAYVLDARTLAPLRKQPLILGGNVWGAVASRKPGRLWGGLNTSPLSIVEIDLGTWSVLRTIALSGGGSLPLTPGGRGVRALAVSPKGDTLYLPVPRVDRESAVVVCVDLATGKCKYLSVNDFPERRVVDEARNRLYVSSAMQNYISPIDMTRSTLLGLETFTGVSGMQAMAVSPSEDKLCAQCQDGRVVVFDAAARTMLTTLKTTAREASDMVISPHGDKLYVAHPTSGKITVLNLAPLAGDPPYDVVRAGQHPYSLALSADGKTLYVADYGDVSGDGGGLVPRHSPRRRHALPAGRDRGHQAGDPV